MISLCSRAESREGWLAVGPAHCLRALHPTAALQDTVQASSSDPAGPHSSQTPAEVRWSSLCLRQTPQQTRTPSQEPSPAGRPFRSLTQISGSGTTPWLRRKERYAVVLVPFPALGGTQLDISHVGIFLCARQGNL